VLLAAGEGSAHAYITDFGVARNVATESGLTQTGRFVGTLDYVAPEQISGGEIDARTDVYALGCLLFKLLTGDVPFPKDGEAARLYAHLNDPPPAPSLYVPELSMALDDVVIRAMSKSPDDRHPSAGDLGRAAQAALRGERPALPEQTVATGAAATRTAETIAVPEVEATAATRQQTVARGSRQGPHDLRRIAIAGGALALVAAIAAIVVLASGGGGSNQVAADNTAKPTHPSPKPPPKTLGRSELLAKADAICTDSKVTYVATLHEFPEGETTPSVPYSRTLAGISTRAVRKLNLLSPPASLRKPYLEYVAAQERVKAYDRQALEAAEAGDTTAYLSARERRDDEAGERYDLARAVGLEKCSTSR
jgi:hypothetical protein